MPEITALSQAAYEALVAFLEKDGWNAECDLDSMICTTAYVGENGRFSVTARVVGHLDHLLFRARAQVTIPERARAAVSEFITRANFGLHIGAFEMDLEDGEVRFKSSLDFQDMVLNDTILHNHLYPVVEAMDNYHMGLLAVASGAKTPAQAIREIEED